MGIQPDSIIPNPSNSQAFNRYSYVMNQPINLSDPSGHKCIGDPGECLGTNNKPINGVSRPIQRSGNNNNGGGGDDDPGENGNASITTPTATPNPSLSTLVPLAAIFSVTTAFVEVAIVIAEGAMAPIDAAMPIVGIPLSLTLAAAGAAVLDLDIAFVVYTARIADHPEVHQEFEVSPLKLWGLKK